MQDWLTYRLSDLILFSPRTYYRLFELYHRDIWPAQLIALGVIAAIVALLVRGDGERQGVIIGALLAACWLWVAVAFHLQRYATINWAARYFAGLFIVQAALLVWAGVVRRRLAFDSADRRSRWPAISLFLVAALAPSVAGVATDRTWGQVELFGLTPDATVIATLGLLAGTTGAPRVLSLAPLCWCLIGGATLWALGSAEAWVSIVTGMIGLIGVARRRRQ